MQGDLRPKTTANRFQRSVQPNVRWRSARRRSNEKSAKQIQREVAVDAFNRMVPVATALSGRSWSDMPLGTRAHSSIGGYWERVARGWKAMSGTIFPTPGGDVSHVSFHRGAVPDAESKTVPQYGTGTGPRAQQAKRGQNSELPKIIDAIGRKPTL